MPLLVLDSEKTMSMVRLNVSMLRKIKSLMARDRTRVALRILNSRIRKLSELTHKLQFIIEWRLGNNPEHFDHQIELHYSWGNLGKSYSMERGVFSSFAILSNEKAGVTLDLCCGDGFFSYYFYSLHSNRVIGIDFDSLAIDSARRNYSRENVEFILGDIRSEFPKGPFQNIIWDAAIEHFTELEIMTIMKNIKDNLDVKGILSGYTIQESEDGKTHLHQHEYEFKNKDDLLRFLSPYFKNIQIIETPYIDRTNYYFFATNGTLPLLNDKFVLTST